MPNSLKTSHFPNLPLSFSFAALSLSLCHINRRHLRRLETERFTTKRRRITLIGSSILMPKNVRFHRGLRLKRVFWRGASREEKGHGYLVRSLFLWVCQFAQNLLWRLEKLMEENFTFHVKKRNVYYIRAGLYWAHESIVTFLRSLFLAAASRQSKL